ncbi:unnamed protein product [Rhizophagus irregularis]|nr:unnamed protein product [Rhizophagus irregularis]
MPPIRRDKEKEKGTRKRKRLSYAEKKGLCEWKKDNPSYNQEELAKKFDISKSQVCSILKEKEKWLSIDISNKEVKIKNGIEVLNFQKLNLHYICGCDKR